MDEGGQENTGHAKRMKAGPAENRATIHQMQRDSGCSLSTGGLDH